MFIHLSIIYYGHICSIIYVYRRKWHPCHLLAHITFILNQEDLSWIQQKDVSNILETVCWVENYRWGKSSQHVMVIMSKFLKSLHRTYTILFFWVAKIGFIKVNVRMVRALVNVREYYYVFFSTCHSINDTYSRAQHYVFSMYHFTSNTYARTWHYIFSMCLSMSDMHVRAQNMSPVRVLHE